MLDGAATNHSILGLPSSFLQHQNAIDQFHVQAMLLSGIYRLASQASMEFLGAPSSAAQKDWPSPMRCGQQQHEGKLGLDGVNAAAHMYITLENSISASLLFWPCPKIICQRWLGSRSRRPNRLESNQCRMERIKGRPMATGIDIPASVFLPGSGEKLPSQEKEFKVLTTVTKRSPPTYIIKR
jgi:hypothetical protein